MYSNKLTWLLLLQSFRQSQCNNDKMGTFDLLHSFHDCIEKQDILEMLTTCPLVCPSCVADDILNSLYTRNLTFFDFKFPHPKRSRARCKVTKCEASSVMLNLFSPIIFYISKYRFRSIETGRLISGTQRCHWWLIFLMQRIDHPYFKAFKPKDAASSVCSK
jgi:hypothetical protein